MQYLNEVIDSMVKGKWKHYAWRDKKQQGERKKKDRVFQTRDDEQAREVINEVDDLLILDIAVVFFFFFLNFFFSVLFNHLINL